MATATDQFDYDTPLATDLQQFAYLANNLVELLETAKYALERDREAAKASLVTASSILQSEIERRSRAKGARPSPLAAWQTARVRAFVDENLRRKIHARDLSAAARRSKAHFSVLQKSPLRNTAPLRGEEAAGEGVSSDDDHLGNAERNSSEYVGFSDQAHLCRRFRQAFGQSPSRWRRDLERG